MCHLYHDLKISFVFFSEWNVRMPDCDPYYAELIDLFFFFSLSLFHDFTHQNKKKLFFRNINMRSVTLSATGFFFFFFFLRLLKFLSCTELVDRMQVCSAAYWDSGSRTCWVHSSARVIAAPDRTPSLTAASYFLSTPLGQKKKKNFYKKGCFVVGNPCFWNSEYISNK